MTHDISIITSRNFDKAFWKQFWYTNVAYTTYLFYGLMRGYPVFLIPQMKSSETVKTPSDISVVTGVSFFTNPIGSVIAGFLMDKRGRKFTMLVSMLNFTVGWAVTACSTTVLGHNTGNTIIGIAIGMAACSPTYVVEISDTKYRSMFLSVLEVHFALGVLIATVSTCFLKWNLSASIFAVLAIISTILMWGIPETPIWLLKNRRNFDALQTFSKLRDPVKTVENDRDFNEIVKLNELENVQVKGMIRTFRDNLKGFLILLGLHILLQGCGFSALLAHLTMFLEGFEIHQETKSSNFITIGFVVCQFLVSFLTPITVYYWPRRKVTMLSGIGMSIPLAIISFCSTFPNMHFVKSNVIYVIPTCLYLYLCSCTIGLLTLSQAMIGELYPTEARGRMVGLTEAMSCTLSGLAVSSFPLLYDIIGMSNILYFFTYCSVLTIFFGFFVLPETFGKSLNEIQEQYFNKTKRKESTTKDEVNCSV